MIIIIETISMNELLLLFFFIILQCIDIKIIKILLTNKTKFKK